MENLKKPVGIWIRVSTEDQAKGESPEHHEKRASFYAQSKGWDIKEVYHLEAVSGKSVLGHPETKRMLEDIKAGHITGLIFSKLARLARNTRELLEISEIFRENNADLISLQEAIDTSTPSGRLFFTMIAAMAQWEREEIAERVAASVPIRAKLGKPLGGQASFGYQWKDKKLIPDPKEAPIRKLIYELFLEHKRKKTVARLLNEGGYRTRNGSKWTDTTIDRLLRDPTAKGLHRLNYTRSPGEKKHWVLKPEHDWVYQRVEPIISEEIWNACNAFLDEQKKNRRPPARKTVHLFSGVTYCSCGNKMYVPSNTPKYVCQRCRNKIPVVDLEKIFHEQLKDFFFSSNEITRYLEKADKVIKEKQELLNLLLKEHSEVQRNIDRIYDLYLQERITADEFGERHKPLDLRQKEITDEIPKLQGEIDFLRIQYLSSDQILSDAKDLYSRWPNLTPDEKRKVIENITEKITIGKNDVEIDLFYLPSPSETVASGQRNFIPALPFCHFRLKGEKIPHNYPKDIKRIGDHLKKKRLDLGLTQKQVAKRIGVSASTIYNWEKVRTDPPAHYCPGIFDFLGYVPYDPLMPFRKKLACWRKSLGLTQRQFAAQFGFDPSTVMRWETGKSNPEPQSLKRIKRMFEAMSMICSDSHT